MAAMAVSLSVLVALSFLGDRPVDSSGYTAMHAGTLEPAGDECSTVRSMHDDDFFFLLRS